MFKLSFSILMYRDTFHAIRIAIHFARIAILANRGISNDNIHCALVLLPAARAVMHKLVCQC